MPRTTKPAARKPLPGPGIPRQYRMKQSHLDAIARLARHWGGSVRDLSATEVLHEAIRRAHVAEFGSEP